MSFCARHDNVGVVSTVLHFQNLVVNELCGILLKQGIERITPATSLSCSSQILLIFTHQLHQAASHAAEKAVLNSGQSRWQISSEGFI